MANGRPALVVAQSGGPTAAINASLAGVVEAALASDRIGAVLGARFGIEGVLTNQFTDLRAQDPSIWPLIRRTPSAALGSCRRKLLPDERAAAVHTLAARHVRYILYIGGNDSADTALGLLDEARRQGVELSIISVPKTVDNDLPGTDHCPGYGSAARYIAQSTQDAGLDTEAMRLSDPVKIIEVAGRDAGWLAAASILGRRDERDAPHLVCVPERALDPAAFIGAIEATYRRLGYAVAVVAETVRDPAGQPIGGVHQVREADAFGHPAIVGTASALAALLSRALGIKARYDKPGTLQRMAMALASPVDLEEAYAAGATAVRYALEGKNGMMVGLVRSPGAVYRCDFVPVDLREVANRVRLLPPEYLGGDPFDIDPSFIDYAAPLIGPPLLPYARL